jgi:hypothetical protein
MRNEPNLKIEKYRVRFPAGHPMASANIACANTNTGAFEVPRSFSHFRLAIIASTGEGWEHVSVHAVDDDDTPYTPLWEHMQMVKELWWKDDEVVMQLHPRKADYVNFHRHVLHLWRPIGIEIPTPPSILVGPMTEGKEVAI